MLSTRFKILVGAVVAAAIIGAGLFGAVTLIGGGDDSAAAGAIHANSKPPKAPDGAGQSAGGAQAQGGGGQAGQPIDPGIGNGESPEGDTSQPDHPAGNPGDGQPGGGNSPGFPMDPDIACKILGTCDETPIPFDPEVVCKILGNCDDNVDVPLDPGLGCKILGTCPQSPAPFDPCKFFDCGSAGAPINKDLACQVIDCGPSATPKLPADLCELMDCGPDQRVDVWEFPGLCQVVKCKPTLDVNAICKFTKCEGAQDKAALDSLCKLLNCKAGKVDLAKLGGLNLLMKSGTLQLSNAQKLIGAIETTPDLLGGGGRIHRPMAQFN